jgi:sulfite reductase (NADPH) flavoprotein alpha-component
MTLSIWRYSHLGFALSFSVFILLAALTGLVLAFEPINEQLDNSILSNEAKNQSIAKTITLLKKEYKEVVSFEINSHNKALANVVTDKGDNIRMYINPTNAKMIGSLKERNAIYKWTTNLHRSLLFKKTGRVLVGICSFFLGLIALTGCILIIKRQGGVLNFFTKIVKENYNQYFHIIFGRWCLIPIIVITITGVYLSLEKFSLLPKETFSHSVNSNFIDTSLKSNIMDFKIFNNIKLNEIKQIEFPFSEDPNDYYTLYLKDKEIIVNQINGNIMSEYTYPLSKIFSYYSLILHTGHGSIIWSLILLLGCLGILYFMYSGFAMSLSRSTQNIKNKINKNNAEVLILVGSEGGTTLNYANALHKQLQNQNIKSYLTELNKFEVYRNIKQIIIMTATYGDGESPSNANKFINKLKNSTFTKHIDYTIVGFGSRAYKHFCKFAYDIQDQLEETSNTKEINKITTINNNSFEGFTLWTNKISSYFNIPIHIDKNDIGIEKIVTYPFRIKHITPISEQIDNTFLIRLTPLNKLKYTSGDLLAIYPNNDDQKRLYSISKVNTNELLISVKKHEMGVVSNFLHQQKIEDKINAAIIKNSSFHFPKNTNQVILIATGTGIGPFLGMIDNNIKHTNLKLYWGGRNEKSFSIYKDFIEKQLERGHLQQLYTAYSRGKTSKKYVQDIVKQQHNFFANSLENKNTIMICGSVAMQNEVLNTLHVICTTSLNKPLSYFQNRGQILMDCY